MSEDYNKLVDFAYNLHVEGKIEEAKEAYEKLLKLNSNDLNVLNLYAQLNFALKNYDKALDIFKNIYDKTKLEDIKINIIKVYFQKKDYLNALNTIETVKNKDANIKRYMAQAFFYLDNFENAVNSYLDLLNNKETTFDDIFNLSLSYFKLEDYNNALKYALDLYTQNQNDSGLSLHISNIYKCLDNKNKQLEYLIRAYEINHDSNICYLIGCFYYKIYDDEKALYYFNEILKTNPNDRNTLLQVAQIYKRHDKNVCIEIYKQLIELYPDDTGILTRLYIVYQDMCNYKDAYEVALKIIKTDNTQSYAYSFAGDSLNALGRYDEAIKMYKICSENSENSEYCDKMIASIYCILNQGDKAIEIFKNKYPKLLDNDSAYAFIQLQNKNLKEAVKPLYKHLLTLKTENYIDERALKYFYKLKLNEKYGINENEFKKFKTNKNQIQLKKLEQYIKKDIYNKDITNKRILLYNAHGIGDMIMFSRYIKTLEKYTNKIIIQPPKSMLRLIQYNFSKYEIIDDAEITVDENKYDYTSSFYTLLCSLKEVDLRNIPYSKQYYSVDEKLISEKAEMDFMNTSKRKIGLFWMGNPVVMPQRSLQLSELKPLFGLKNTQLYSFQISKIDFESEKLKKEHNLIDLAPHIKDYADTAAFLKNIDILITIDTSIANLSGAMGIKTFLLLPFESEWRWFYDKEKTPWYDSIKIFKQEKPFSWKDPLERIKNELKV